MGKQFYRIGNRNPIEDRDIMWKKRLVRLLILCIVVGVIMFLLSRLSREGVKEGVQEKGEVLSTQAERIIEKIRDLPDQTGLNSLKERALENIKRKSDQVEVERKVEEKVEEIIKEIKSLPEEQLKEIKKTVFCSEICEETCQEVCEED